MYNSSFTLNILNYTYNIVRDIPYLNYIKLYFTRKSNKKYYNNISSKSIYYFKYSFSYPYLELLKYIKRVTIIFIYSY